MAAQLRPGILVLCEGYLEEFRSRADVCTLENTAKQKGLKIP